MPNTHIVGSGISAAIPNALHVNGLWANGIPNWIVPLPLPIGSIVA